MTVNKCGWLGEKKCAGGWDSKRVETKDGAVNLLKAAVINLLEWR
jgi:hypothetical protein